MSEEIKNIFKVLSNDIQGCADRYGDNRDELSKAHETLKELHGYFESLQSENKRLREDNDDLEEKNQNLEEECNDLKKSVDMLKLEDHDREQYKETIRSLREEMEEATKIINTGVTLKLIKDKFGKCESYEALKPIFWEDMKNFSSKHKDK